MLTYKLIKILNYTLRIMRKFFLFLLFLTTSLHAQTYVCTDVSFPNGTGGASAQWEQNFLKKALGSTASIIVYDNYINYSNHIFKKKSENLYECRHEDGATSKLTITGRTVHHANERYLIMSFTVRFYDKKGSGYILTYKYKNL